MRMTIESLPFNTLNQIGAVASADAFLHGLWSTDNSGHDRYDCGLLIRDEAQEAIDAADDRPHFCEELADVVIMTLSAAAYLGIDIGSEVKRKMQINQGRPYKHGKERADHGL